MQVESITFAIISQKKEVTEATAKKIGNDKLKFANHRCKGSCLLKAICNASLKLVLDTPTKKNIRRGKVVIEGNNVGDTNCPLVNEFGTLEQFDV